MEIKPSHRRTCETCLQPFVVPPYYPAHAAEVRRFCTKKCSAIGNWANHKKLGLPNRKPGIEIETPDGIKYIRPGRKPAARARYEANPRLCRECGGAIPLPEGKSAYDIRGRSFCSVPCSEQARTRFWKGEEASDFYNIKTLPSRVQSCTLPFLTLGDDYHYQKRGEVHRHARKVYFSAFPDQTFCQICEKHSPFPVEVCHVRPVGDFKNEDLLLMINQLSNLIGGDHICHKLLDAGLVPPERVEELLRNRIPRIR